MPEDTAPYIAFHLREIAERIRDLGPLTDDDFRELSGATQDVGNAISFSRQRSAA